MNVYEKLAKARMMFQSENIKQNGKNSYAGYTYFELSDILPICNKICEELKVVTVVSFSETIATLAFINGEKSDEIIVFSSPMSQATLKGCHPVQNLGAVETYIKRYLYQNCFEIAESDCLDSTMNPNEQKQTSQKQTSQKQTSQKQTSQKQAPKQQTQQKTENPLPQWTDDQKKELGIVLGTTVNEEPVFTEEEKEVYRECVRKRQAFDFVIKRVRNELDEKLNKKMAQEEQQKDLIEG